MKEIDWGEVRPKLFRDHSVDDLLEVGFERWSESNLYLMPIALYHELKPGEILYSIMGDVIRITEREEDLIKGIAENSTSFQLQGETVVVDKDTRGGMLSYGVFPLNVTPHPEKLKGW